MRGTGVEFGAQVFGSNLASTAAGRAMHHDMHDALATHPDSWRLSFWLELAIAHFESWKTSEISRHPDIDEILTYLAMLGT